MSYSHVIRGQRFVFRNLADLLAKANERKSGDELAGIAAATEQERVAAKLALADVTLGEIAAQPVINPDIDDVSRLILGTHDQERFVPFRGMTVGSFREWLLESCAMPDQLRDVAWAITPEMATAVTKLMSNKGTGGGRVEDTQHHSTTKYHRAAGSAWHSVAVQPSIR